MFMKRLLAFSLFAALTCFAAAALAADVPNLVGAWEGLHATHDAKAGYGDGKLVLTIVEQRGNAFHGTKTYGKVSKKSFTEGFSGTVSSAGQVLIADHDEGYMVGSITKTGEMELQYAHKGRNAVASHILLKKK